MYRNEDKILDTAWHEREDYPEPNKWIIVKDKNGNEFHYHQWIGHAYYDFIVDKESCGGWVSDVDIAFWRYDYNLNGESYNK